MNYKVLYRKYRPDSFESLIGQDNTVKILKNSLTSNKIAHAYIFSGPRGTGKTSSAKIFAKSVNCNSLINGSPCGSCESCLNFSTSHDIIEIDAASNNGVEEIREITNNIKLAPNALKYKVYIIDEVHMLSQSAFNALLLTLEEPPSHVIFILATTNIENVPITILSRCQRFDFRKICISDICDKLKSICKEEKIIISDEAIAEIAYLSDGGMRDSLSLLDQLSKEEINIDIENVLKVVGNISKHNVVCILDAIENGDINTLVNKIDEISSKSLDYKLLIKSLIDESAKRSVKLVLNNEINNFSVSNYRRLMFDLTDLMNKINVNVDVYKLLLITLLSNVINLDVINKNVHNEQKVNNIVKEDASIAIETGNEGVEMDKNTNINQEIKDIRINNCFFGVKKEEKLKHIEFWSDFVNDLENRLKGLLFDTKVLAASNEVIIIGVEIVNNIEDINKDLNILEKYYSSFVKNNVKLLFLSLIEWDKYSKEFVKNMNNGVKYNYIEENVVQKCELSDIACDIFGDDIIKEG